jgi:hypothetical protein
MAVQRAAERGLGAENDTASTAGGAKGRKGGKGGKAAAAGGAGLTDAIRDELERSERALELGQAGEALRRADGLMQQLPANLRLLQLRAAALAGAGDAHDHAVALHRLHVLRDDPDVRRRERVAGGRLLVTSPGWLPRLPGDPSPIRPSGEEVVLFLADHSGPYRTSPTAERLRARLADLTAVGWRPEVVTALGFPRTSGVAEVASFEEVDGIPHHRLDLGPHYALDGPPDRRLRDAAWLAAGVVRRVLPAVLHGLVDGSGTDPADMALVAAAVARHTGLPLVLEIVADPGLATTPDARRARATLAGALQLADGVVTADAATRDGLVSGGLDTARVTIAPIGGDPAGRDDDLRAVYASVSARGGSERGA